MDMYLHIVRLNINYLLSLKLLIKINGKNIKLSKLLNLEIKELDLKYINGVRNQRDSIILVDNLSDDQIIIFKENKNIFGD